MNLPGPRPSALKILYCHTFLGLATSKVRLDDELICYLFFATFLLFL